MLNTTGYVILRKGYPQGIDRDSGGYPFDAKFIGEVKFWSDLKQAQDFCYTMNVCLDGDAEYVVAKTTYNIDVVNIKKIEEVK